MNKAAIVALFIAVSLQGQAQNPPMPKETAASTSETAPQKQAPPAGRIVVREFPLSEEAVKKIWDLGYDFSLLDLGNRKIFSTGCAIPLTPIPVPEKGNFAIRNTPANPSIDPKIVIAPPLPACARSVVVPKVIKPVQPEAEKK